MRKTYNRADYNDPDIMRTAAFHERIGGDPFYDIFFLWTMGDPIWKLRLYFGLSEAKVKSALNKGRLLYNETKKRADYRLTPGLAEAAYKHCEGLVDNPETVIAWLADNGFIDEHDFLFFATMDIIDSELISTDIRAVLLSMYKDLLRKEYPKKNDARTVVLMYPKGVNEVKVGLSLKEEQILIGELRKNYVLALSSIKVAPIKYIVVSEKR